MYLLHFCLVALHIRALLAFCDKIYARETTQRVDILPFRFNSVALRTLLVGISPFVLSSFLRFVRLAAILADPYLSCPGLSRVRSCLYG